MVVSRTTQSATTSRTSSKGPLSHPVVLVPAGLAILLGAYALGYLPQLGTLLRDADRLGRSVDIPGLSPAVSGIAGIAAFLILLGLVRSVDMLLQKLRDTVPLKARLAKPVEQFIEEATAARVSRRVAREIYSLLEPHYPKQMSIDLNDNLRTDLQLSDDDIQILNAQLFTRCERHALPADANVRKLLDSTTVFDLLQRVEAATPLRADRSGSRERATDFAPANAAGGKRQSDSAQRKALHAATIQAIETGSLHLSGASGLHRRSSDYRGPRRRVTDQRGDPEYTGPFQRVTDVVRGLAADPAPQQALERQPEQWTKRGLDLQSERQPGRPPASSPERRAQPAPDPPALNRRDSMYVAPLPRPGPESTRSGRTRD